MAIQQPAAPERTAEPGVGTVPATVSPTQSLSEAGLGKLISLEGKAKIVENYEDKIEYVKIKVKVSGVKLPPTRDSSCPTQLSVGR